MRRSYKDLSHDEVVEFLDYDPLSGLFRWKKSTSNRAPVGSLAGSSRGLGYLAIQLNGALCYSHRLAWFYIYKRWPAFDTDHINLDKRDNRIANLREASRAQNKWNIGPLSNNKSGAKGIRKRLTLTGDERFEVQLQANGKQFYIGTFSSMCEAKLAHAQAAETHHAEFKRIA
jgi:hypothetical protein